MQYNGFIRKNCQILGNNIKDKKLKKLILN